MWHVLRNSYILFYTKFICILSNLIIDETIIWLCSYILGESQNDMPPIPVPSSGKRIATQILVIASLNGKKDFIFRVFVSDIIRPSKELPV